MAVLAGLSVTEAMMCAPGLLFDMVKLKARQGGWRKEWEED